MSDLTDQGCDEFGRVIKPFNELVTSEPIVNYTKVEDVEEEEQEEE